MSFRVSSTYVILVNSQSTPDIDKLLPGLAQSASLAATPLTENQWGTGVPTTYGFVANLKIGFLP